MFRGRPPLRRPETEDPTGKGCEKTCLRHCQEEEGGPKTNGKRAEEEERQEDRAAGGAECGAKDRPQEKEVHNMRPMSGCRLWSLLIKNTRADWTLQMLHV